MKTEWIKIPDFPNYEVHSDLGVRHASSQKLLKGRNWFGYPKVTLMKDNKKYERRIHRLVGENFIPNPNNFPILNHKDSDRSNHSVSNLEWVDNSGNQLHRWKTQKMGLAKKKYNREYGEEPVDNARRMLESGLIIKKAAIASNMTRIKKLRMAKKMKSKGIDPKYMVREESYKAADMGRARRAINHMLPFNSVVF